MITRCLRVLLTGVLSLPVLVSCQKKDKIVVTEQRELTMYDGTGGPLIAPMPPEWRQVPGTQLRIMNYRFGKDGEVYVSQAKGGVLPNVNRWRKQFALEPISSLDELTEVTMLDGRAWWVFLTGKFQGGMGQPPREDAALAGAIYPLGDGIITVKMIGDKDEVSAEKERMKEFCKNLRIRKSKSEKPTN